MNRSDYVEAIFEVITHRRSVRQFTNELLEPNELEMIVDAGIYAPSSSNSQQQRFLVITNPDELSRIGKIRYVWPYKNAEKMRNKKPSGLIGGASAAIFTFVDAAFTDNRSNGEYYIWEAMESQNGAASIQNMLLMATALGIGSVWVSANEAMSGTRLLGKKQWKEVLYLYDLPDTYKLQGIVLLGKPKGLDDLGFPKGEKMHGATLWESTQRKERKYYIINNELRSSNKIKLGLFYGILLSSLSHIQRLLKFFSRVVDYISSKIECYILKKYK